MNITTVDVPLGVRSYPILITTGFAALSEPLIASRLGEHCFIVTNTVLGPLYGQDLVNALNTGGRKLQFCEIPDGETAKQTATLEKIYTALIAANCDRATSIIALGGGVVGDIAGFAAATYQRGIPYVQIPTTLLAMVDSSVGGKTAINHVLGKNMIGAFWQPKFVYANLELLDTLPPREFSAGLAEIIKYGLIRDADLLHWIDRNMNRVMSKDREAMAYVVQRSCSNKSQVVVDDEFETARNNGRALLNLGHTFGHAIETGVGYGTWLHGEAVAAGTVMAAELSRLLGWLNAEDVDLIRRMFLAANLPVVGPKMGGDRYLELMSRDKKVMAGKLRLVLLKKIGEAVTYADASEADIRAAIEMCCE